MRKLFGCQYVIKVETYKENITYKDALIKKQRYQVWGRRGKVLSQSLVEHEEQMQGGLVYSTWQRIAVEGTCNCVKAEM